MTTTACHQTDCSSDYSSDENFMSDGSSIEHVHVDKVLLTKARMLVLVHNMFRLKYDVAILMFFIDPAFGGVVYQYWTPLRKMALVCKFMLLTGVTITLPFVYGHSIMEYPCEDEAMRVNASVVDVASVECQAQDYIRSYWSFAFAPWACCVGALLVGASHVLDCISRCLCCSFEVGRKLRAYAKHYAYAMVDSKIATLKYTDPRIHNMVTTQYVFILAEMMLVSVIQLSGVAMLVGVAVANLFLMVANVLLSPHGSLVAKVEAEIHKWPVATSGKTAVRGMFARLREQSLGGDTIYATMDELDAIYDHVSLGMRALQEIVETDFGNSLLDITKLRYLPSPPFFRLRRGLLRDFRFGAWESYLTRYVYIVDNNITVDCVGEAD